MVPVCEARKCRVPINPVESVRKGVISISGGSLTGELGDRRKAASGEPAASPRARGEETRNRILDAAQEIFGSQGYHAASIGEITKAAGVGLGSFYLHFTSKLEIYRYLLRSRQEDFLLAARRASAGASDQREALRTAFRAFFDWITAHPTVLRMLREAEFVDPSLVVDLYQKPALAFRDGLAQQIERGRFASTDPEVLAWCLMGMTEFCAMRWIVWRGGEPMPDERFEAFIDIITRVYALPSKGD